MTSEVSYVLPVSDDGGSTAEIIRVLGGPAIGDIRSRLVRLSDDSTTESKAVLKLLQHRLPVQQQQQQQQQQQSSVKPEEALAACPARLEWLQIVDGSHRRVFVQKSLNNSLCGTFFNYPLNIYCADSGRGFRTHTRTLFDVQFTFLEIV